MGLFGRRKPPSSSAPAETDVTSVDDTEIPRYPPFLKGLPVAAPARIVATQRELIARLQDGLAFTDARFATLVRPVVERYAAFVHLLPASEAHHHRGAGGLFRHGLEVAFHAAQASQGRIFALDRSPAERRELEPRWRLAAGLAGLCHDVGKPVSDLSVSDREGRTTWRPLLESLTDWAAANGVEHYFLRWRERRHARHETFGLLVLERILTPEVTAWLVDADPEIMQGLLSAVAGIDDGAVLGSLVTEADRASVERDLRENHIDPAATSLGVPVDRYLLDAMRRLARGGRWQINVPGARLWMLAEGLHLVWPAGAEDVVSLLAADKVPGIPRDPDTLADILLERGLAVPAAGGGYHPPLLATGARSTRTRRSGGDALHAALRLARSGARGSASGTGGFGACIRGGRAGDGVGPADRGFAKSHVRGGYQWGRRGTGARGCHVVLSGYCIHNWQG